MINFLRTLVLKDFLLKLFSLALAGLIWFTIRIAIDKDATPAGPLTVGQPAQRTFPNLPVVVLSSAADVRSFKVTPKEADVTVQGEAKTLENLQSKDIHVLVDLTGIDTGRDLRKRIEVSTPSGITHVRVAPEEVRIVFPPKT
jgi:YbbR domain-containing protein